MRGRMATPHARRATTPFGQAVRGPNPSQSVESTILTANPENLTRRDPRPSPAQRRTPAARPIYSDSESSEDDLWRAPASVLLVDGTPGRGAMRAARQAETMEELEIDPPPARVSSSSGRAGPSPRSTPGYDPGSDDGMEYEDSDLEREADEYRAMLVGASGGGGRVFRNTGAFTTPKPKPKGTEGFRQLSPGASFGSRGPVRGSLHRPSPTSSGGAMRAVDFETTTTARDEYGVDGETNDVEHVEHVAAAVSGLKGEFEAIRRELAEIKSNMSSPATATADPNLDGGTPSRGEYPHGPRRAFVDRGSFGGGGGTVARDVHSGGDFARQQQRRDSNGSTEGGRVGSGHVGSRRSASSSKTSARHRSGRKVSSEATGTGRLLFGDDDGDRSGGSAGGADDGVRRRGGEPGAVNRRHSTGDEAPGSNDSSLRRGGGSGPGSNESSFRQGMAFDRTRSESPRESTRERRATRETAVNTDRSEAEEGGGGGIAGRRGNSPSRKSSGREGGGGESVVVSALRLFALMLLLVGTWYMVLVIVDVIEEDFLSGRLPRSNLFLDSLTRVPLEFLAGAHDGLDDDPPFAAPT